MDSVYLRNNLAYNLLMKVDSNTKGNTYWFMFKVTNFIVGQTYTFHILNFTRSIEKFYKDKMNIVTKAVNGNPHASSSPTMTDNGDSSVGSPMSPSQKSNRFNSS